MHVFHSKVASLIYKGDNMKNKKVLGFVGNTATHESTRCAADAGFAGCERI